MGYGEERASRCTNPYGTQNLYDGLWWVLEYANETELDETLDNPGLEKLTCLCQ